MTILELTFASGESSLSVRRFSVHETVSAPFTVSVWARSSSANLDLEGLVGKTASLHIQSGVAHARTSGRTWSGLLSHIEQVQAEPTGLSTYYMRIVPELWGLSHRRNHRIFQHKSIPDIVEKVLSEWNIKPVFRIDRGRYPKLEYKVQYGEPDLGFLSRLLEEAGIAYFFEDKGKKSELVLADEPGTAEARGGGALPSVDNPNEAAEQEYVTRVRLSHEVRPGAHTIRDYDFRKPGFALFGESPKAPAPEDKYEQYEYRPHGFLVEGGKGGGTPSADDKGVARHEQSAGKARAEKALAAQRAGKRSVSFSTNVLDLRPGQVFSIGQHAHPEISESSKLLVLEATMEGSPDGEWLISGQAMFAEAPYRPPQRSPKPEVSGVQSATVVGPGGEEIHTDEFGRVRVQFPWDREGSMDENSSCWMRVSQGWAGTGFGLINIPRIGQEVLVGFLNGDPDAPIIVGRAFNQLKQVPYKLPHNKTRSAWKSDSSPGGGGFNEIMFEDLKGHELVWMQAQKNMRKLVKNDETMTIGRDRMKYVVRNETETTGGNRVEVTRANRTEITQGNRTFVIGANEEKLVKGSEVEKTEGDLTVFVGGDEDIVVKQIRRETVEGDSHLTVRGKRAERVDGKQSLYVNGDRHEKVGGDHRIATGKALHLKAGASIVIEASDITLKGPGGFVRIDSSGVTVQGSAVKVNSGGEAGKGEAASPDKPAAAVEAVVEEPSIPEPENLLESGIGQ